MRRYGEGDAQLYNPAVAGIAIALGMAAILDGEVDPGGMPTFTARVAQPGLQDVDGGRSL